MRKYKYHILYLLILLFLASCSQPDVSFEDKIIALEANPELFISRIDTHNVSRITTEEEATDFLLLSLSKKYINRNYYPEKEKLQKSIHIFDEKKKIQQQLEALYLLAELYKREKDLANEIATVETAIRLAKQEDDNKWLFYLYSYLGDMYIRKYNMLKFIKYQTLANQCMKDINVRSTNIHARIQIAKSLLYIGRYTEANDLLQSMETSVSSRHVCYSDYKRLQGIVLFKLEKWESCIKMMQASLEQEDLQDYKFVCYSVLTYCYYHIGDLKNAELYKNLAIANDMEGETNFTEIEFYKLCADFAREHQNMEEQFKCINNVIERYEDVVKELNSQSLDEAIQAYTRIYEKRQYEQQIRRYQYVAFGLVLLLAVFIIFHVNRKKKQAYQLLSLQQQIHTLEALENIKNETKSLILRDMEIAKHISMLKHTRKEKSEKLLKELDKLNLLEGNKLLNTQWEGFYHHIDITFDDFHRKLTDCYPSLNEKEIQLCCLMKAGFRTEEIAAVWMQSVFTVHKYKTSIRKKANAPEAADIIAFLEEKLL